MQQQRFWKLLAVLAALALVAAACGGDDDSADDDSGDTTAATTTPSETEAGSGTDEDMDDEPPGDMSDLGLPVIDPLDVPEGDVAIAGSSTVFPLSTAVLSQWIDEGGPEYSIDSIGSGGGFERFCVEGGSDISNASRPIKEEEVAACTDTWGSEPIEIRVGTDALSLVVSPGNTFATELTFEQVATAFSLPSGSTWADVDPAFPAHPIQTFSPGADSGTFDFFFETIYPEVEEADGTPPILESGAEIVGEDDNITVQGVSQDGCTEGDTSTTCAIGYFGYAFFQQNADVLQVVGVDGGDGPVVPNDDSVNAGEYPISRPLYMYTAPEVVADKPQVASFIAYYLNTVNDVIGDVGYFPAPADALQEAADNIAAAAGF